MQKRRRTKYLIEFHRSYLIMALGFVLAGYYLNLVVFTSLIVVHELGHYLMARINKIKVDKIIIYPYGGLTKLEGLINRDIGEELLVATSGIIMQYIFYLSLCYGNKIGIIREYTFNLYTLYNSQMIFFNLLPIYPLDGGKIVNLLFSKYFYYDMANRLTIFVSGCMIIFIVFLSIYKCSYSNVMTFGLIFSYLYKFYKERKYLYKRFLLERYLYDIEYPKIKVIKDGNKMFKNKSHLINIDNHYIKEKKYLSILFSKR